MKRCFFLKAMLAAVMLLPGMFWQAKGAEVVDPYAGMTQKEQSYLTKWEVRILNMTGFREQEEALEEYKAYTAQRGWSKHYLWAGEQLVSLREGRNWKVAESERAKLAQELKSLGYWLELALTGNHSGGSFRYGYSEPARVDSLLAAHRAELLARRTSKWYNYNPLSLRQDPQIGLPTSQIANDYEYLLWRAILAGGLPKEKQEQYLRLLQEAFAARLEADSLDLKRLCELGAFATLSDSAEFETFKLRNRETDLAPLAEDALIHIEKQRIDSGKKWSQAAALALDARCRAFEAQQKQLRKGKNLSWWEMMHSQASWPHRVAESLNGKGVITAATDSVFLVLFKNTPQASLTLKGAEQGGRHKEKVVNPTPRYYLTDTVKIAIPNLPDDTYTITTRGGGKKEVITCTISSLAVAWRYDGGLREFYVTDSKTGRPVDSVSLWLRRGDTTMRVKKPLIAALRPDGFTRLPAELEKAAADSLHSYEFWFTTKDAGGLYRQSNPVYLQRPYTPWKPQASDHGAIYLDRSVVQGGDSVRFKAIAWHRSALGEQTVLPEGRKLQVILSAPREAKGDTLTLVTNEFGAVAGGFRLPKEALGGIWQLQLLEGRNYLSSTGFLVGDIVLPTFDAAFDPIDRVILPGEELAVSGTVTMLSGHPASGARIAWKSGKESGETACESDGRFRIALRPEGTWASLQLDITTAEGETRSFNKSYNLSPALTLTLEALRDGLSSSGFMVIRGETLLARFKVASPDGSATRTPVSYRLKAGETLLASGEIPAGELLQIPLPAEVGRRFTLEAEIQTKDAKGRDTRSSIVRKLYRMEDTDTALDAPVEWYLEKRPCENGVKARFGGARGDIWAIAELWGTDAAGATVRFATQRIHILGTPGAEGSLQDFFFPRNENWSENLTLSLLWFKDRRLQRRSLEYHVEKEEIPVEFTRFTDAVHPGAEATFTLRTRPGTEGVVTVFDKAMNTLRNNHWPVFSEGNRTYINVPYCQQDAGSTWSWYAGDFRYTDNLDETVVIAYGTAGPRSTGLTRGAVKSANTVMFKSAASAERAVAEEAVLYSLKDDAAAQSADMGGGITTPETFRSDLSAVLAFEPLLRPDADGNISFTVKASDRLSQFVVRALVHDKQARSALTERLMTVTLPVKVGLLPPAVLYEKDRVEFAATAANASQMPVTGRISLQLFDGPYSPGARPLLTRSQALSVPAGATEAVKLTAEEIPAISADTLGILVAFTSDGATDALAQAVPIRPRAQILTETHSMLLCGGADLQAARTALLKAFQNADPEQVIFEERTIAQLLDSLEKSLCRYEREDAISLSGALLVRNLLGQEADSLTQKLAACQNTDGGFGWMKGMPSSPYVTAMVLDRFARIDKRDGSTRRAIQWLDSVCLSEKKTPLWRGGISIQLYLYVRSLFPELPIVGRTSYARNEEARDWLNPNKLERKYECLYARALRARTLLNMTASDQGVDLAKFFGFTFFAETRLRRSLEKEAEFLLEYAVEHPSGGYYYPNLVMPWRGLMESEAYAHAFVCDILRDIAARERSQNGNKNEAFRSGIDEESSDGNKMPAICSQNDGVPEGSGTGGSRMSGATPTAAEIADGIRLWLLTQRETQAWREEPGYAMAVASIREGLPELLQTRVLIARSESLLPLEKIKAAGNEMKVERQWQVKRGGKWTALGEGQTLKVGDRVRSVLNLWSKENRSFVIVTAPRPGNLQPVNQASGYADVRGGYRNVRSDRTEFLFDAYPEEKLQLTEEYYVTQAGQFAYSPAEIVCTYADHYRANDRNRPTLKAIRQ